MRKLGAVLAVVAVLGVPLAAAQSASADGRRLCYADSNGVVMARNTSCRTAEAVTAVAARRFRSLRPFTVHVPGYGTWRCKPYINARDWLDILCHKGRQVAGVAVKQS